MVLEPLNFTYVTDGNIIKIKSQDDLAVEPVDGEPDRERSLMDTLPSPPPALLQADLFRDLEWAAVEPDPLPPVALRSPEAAPETDLHRM